MEKARKLIQPFYRFTIETITKKIYSGYIDKESEEEFLVIHSSRNLDLGAMSIIADKDILTIEFSNKKYGGFIYKKISKVE